MHGQVICLGVSVFAIKSCLEALDHVVCCRFDCSPCQEKLCRWPLIVPVTSDTCITLYDDWLTPNSHSTWFTRIEDAYLVIIKIMDQPLGGTRKRKNCAICAYAMAVLSRSWFCQSIWMTTAKRFRVWCQMSPVTPILKVTPVFELWLHCVKAWPFRQRIKSAVLIEKICRTPCAAIISSYSFCFP